MVRIAAAWSLLAALALAATAVAGDQTAEDGPPAATQSPALADDTGARHLYVLVTLGDAYTLGTETDAPKRDSWPSQLVTAFKHSDTPLRLINLAEAGQSSGNVVSDQLPHVQSWQPDLVTIQVGVNDIWDGEGEDYASNMATIFDALEKFMPSDRIFAITTPDHGLTPYGSLFGTREEASQEVARFNAVLRDVAGARGIQVIDIGPVNQRVATDLSLLIGDGPYPSAKQYAGWVEIIGPYLYRALHTPAP
jgi:acyl-CoA thioesterase-1